MLKLRNETKIGIFAIIATALAIWGFQFLKGINMLSRSKEFYVRYSNVAELRPSAYVFINGYQVGTVEDMYIDKVDDKTIIAVLRLKAGVDIPKNTRAVIISQGLMGGKAINLEFDKPCDGDCAEDGDYLEGGSQTFMESIVGDPKQLDAYMQRLQIGLTTIYDSIADPRDPQGLGRTLLALQQSMQNLALMTSKINRFLDAATTGYTETGKNAAEITKALRESNKDISATLANLAILSDQLKTANLGTSAEKANNALDSVTVSMAALRTTLQGASLTLTKVDTLAQRLVSGQGTAGKLLNDEEMYENLNRTIRQMQLLMQDLRLNPKRYNTVKLKVFGKNKTKDYANPVDDPAYQLLIDSLERDYNQRLKQ